MFFLWYNVIMGKKREMSENSLKNLKMFTKEYQPSPKTKSEGAKKGWEKKREFKAMKDAATELLMRQLPGGEIFQDVALNKIADLIENGEIKASDLIKAVEFLRDTSGQKPLDKPEIDRPEPPVINIGFKI